MAPTIRPTFLFSVMAGLGIVFAVSGKVLAQEVSIAKEPVECKDLASLSVSDTTITTAATVAAGSFEPPVPDSPIFAADYSRLPTFCRVTGSIKPTPDSDIRFELWLPAENWNGKFLQTGNGGAAGSIIYSSLAEPLTRGYAVTNTDTGHQGTVEDFSWAVGHPEKMIDFQYRAVHELTIVGLPRRSGRSRLPEKRRYGSSVPRSAARLLGRPW